MSRWMQVDIRLLPAYGSGGLVGRFPKLAGFFKDYGYKRVIEEEPSLYHLVEVLGRIGRDPQIPKPAKRGIVNMVERLEQVRDAAREHLLGRRLNELDKVLYGLEDLFEELERNMDW